MSTIRWPVPAHTSTIDLRGSRSFVVTPGAPAPPPPPILPLLYRNLFEPTDGTLVRIDLLQVTLGSRLFTITPGAPAPPPPPTLPLLYQPRVAIDLIHVSLGSRLLVPPGPLIGPIGGSYMPTYRRRKR